MGKLKKLIFYCEYGNGDIFESREFVKEFYEFYQPEECYYAHGKHPDIIKDMTFLESIAFDPTEMKSMRPYAFYGDVLYVNTWIGRDSKFVLPGIGCVVEQLYLMYNELMVMMQTGYKLQKNPLDYIPKIDFSYYPNDGVTEFLKGKKRSKNVLLLNGPVHSGQAENFNFDPVMDKICTDNPKVNFIASQRSSVYKDNLTYTDDITHNSSVDLNEIAYLSTFCKLIVGRNSGPHVFTQHYDNWMDSKKVNLSFTFKKEASHFVLSDSLPMRKEWSPATETNQVVTKINNLI